MNKITSDICFISLINTIYFIHLLIQFFYFIYLLSSFFFYVLIEGVDLDFTIFQRSKGESEYFYI